MDIDELKARFLNLEYDRQAFEIDAEKLSAVALATGESRPEYADTNHPDFQATPAFIASLSAGRHLPIDFPKLGGIPMDGGKAVTCVRPMRPGTPITGHTHLHDIYAKSGRSGRMIFIVARIEFFDEGGEPLAVSDSRMVVREKPSS